MSGQALVAPALAGLLSILLVELALRLPFAVPLAAVWGTAAKALRVTTSGRISDHWKEKALLAYAGAMLGASLRLGALLLVLAAAAAAMVLAADAALGTFERFVLSGQGIVLTLVVACAWLPLRRALSRRLSRRAVRTAQGAAPR